MTKLNNSTVYRGGATATRWTEEPDANPVVTPSKNERSIELRFSVPSKGGGTLDLQLTVRLKDFGKLFGAMMEAGGKS